MSDRMPGSLSPVVSGVFLFAAPVGPGGGVPAIFDPSRQGRFPLDTPPAGWFALGAVPEFGREEEAGFAEVWSGAPAVLALRARNRTAATLRCTFAGWSKLAMALSSGSQQMNLLRTAPAFTPANSGGTPEVTALLGGTADTVLRVRKDFSVSAGDLLVVDEDYAGEAGAVGAPVAGAYLLDPARVGNDVHYRRRVSYNLARVVSVAAEDAAQAVTLASPLPAGPPSGTMRVSVVEGFADRVGGSYLSEWSLLLVAEGVAGDRVLLHYPRVQTAGGPTEVRTQLGPGLERWRLQAELKALPVVDTVDGDAVLCYRSHLPGNTRV